MVFANTRQEWQRFLFLAVVTVLLEMFVLGGVVFGLLKASDRLPVPLQLIALMTPRLIAMLALVFLLGPFVNRIWFSSFVMLYAVLLFARFNQTEVFINWESVIATARATLPNIAGLIGAVAGFGLRWKPA